MTGPTVAAPARPAAQVWELVARAQAGDADAFGQLYLRYRERVYLTLWRRCRSRDLAEDLTAETFTRAWRAIGTVSWQGRDLLAWLHTIARNLLLDHLGRAATRLTLAGGLDGPAAAVLPDPAPGPEELAAAADTHDRVLAAMRLLTAEQSRCLQLRFLQELSVAETAQVMGINECAVKAVQYRAVRALARHVRELVMV